MSMEYAYPNTRRVSYGDTGASFVPVCRQCGRFVKADDSIGVLDEGEVVLGPNATCRQCGRVEMLFEGYV